MRATATFSIANLKSVDVQEGAPVSTALPLTVKTMEKTLSGEAEGRSRTVFAAAFDQEAGIGTYVAIESFAGSLNGLEGSFNFIHCASTRGRDRSNEFFLIVDGSGTGRLHGISGSGGIRIDEAGTHHLWFDYNLP
ncbi:MAG: DUF3224 domain-containing protein [Mesorhizobium amorphae]|nr:MAG: DUF3224 domain-containing protein [Mesorhizobium amorphae]